MDPKRPRDEEEPKTNEPANNKKPEAPAVFGFGGNGFAFIPVEPVWSAALDAARDAANNNFHNPFAEHCLHICRTNNVHIFNVVFKPSGHAFGWEVCTVHVQSAVLSTITYNKTYFLDARIDWNSLRDLITQETNFILNANTAITVNRTAARTRGSATTKRMQ